MPNFDVLLLVLPSLYTHVIVNQHIPCIRRSAMAEWLTHLTKDVGAPGSSLSESQL